MARSHPHPHPIENVSLQRSLWGNMAQVKMLIWGAWGKRVRFLKPSMDNNVLLMYDMQRILFVTPIKNYSSKDPLSQAKGQFEELLSKHSAVPRLSLAFLMFCEPPKTWFFLLHVYHPPTLSSPHSPSLSLDFSLMILGVNSKMLVAIKDLFLQTKG